jgi:hypothetical protein
MKRASGRSKRNVALSKEVSRRLSFYGLAAGTAGVSLLALAQPARAEVVFTPADITLISGNLFIDLNADGFNDFDLADQWFRFPHSKFPLLGKRKLAVGGAITASVIPSHNGAAALDSGAAIGPDQSFQNVNQHKLTMAAVKSVYHGSTGTCCFYASGNWKSTTDKFLGLKFQIMGETHYGWARVSVKDPVGFNGVTAKLTGYAYETNPDTKNIAGDTGGNSTAANDAGLTPDDMNSGAGTLGALARGAAR